MEIILDGKLIPNKLELFTCIKNQINSNELYGNNLDALWDVLRFIDSDINIKIINFDLLKENLGNYIDSLIELFNNLKESNSKVIIEITD